MVDFDQVICSFTFDLTTFVNHDDRAPRRLRPCVSLSGGSYDKLYIAIVIVSNSLLSLRVKGNH